MTAAFDIHRRCMSCLRVGWCALDCLDRESTVTTIPIIRAVEAPEMSVAVPARDGWVPAWSLVSIVSGGLLMAVGFLLNDPLARVVWEAIPR
jgi:hypothetical protein